MRRRRSNRYTLKRCLNNPHLHGVGGLVSPECARQIILDFLLSVAAVLIGELHADPGGAFALRAFGRHPNDPAGDRKLLFLAHQVEQHEDFIAQAVIAVGRNEEAAVLHERHVREVERALILDRQRQQTGFVTWTSQFLKSPQNNSLCQSGLTAEQQRFQR